MRRAQVCGQGHLFCLVFQGLPCASWQSPPPLQCGGVVVVGGRGFEGQETEDWMATQEAGQIWTDDLGALPGPLCPRVRSLGGKCYIAKETAFDHLLIKCPFTGFGLEIFLLRIVEMSVSCACKVCFLLLLGRGCS